ncbi:arylsulfatase [Haloferula helveola]|uniref:Arylsulfatase n=1 Tax=Haloferula helveola TaxID=490095 RepID=A0ABM7RNF9_9BACT|nr:arylsulfatase [Haloferula helveola]
MYRYLLSLLLILMPAAAAPPNFVIIFTDDQGYGDLGCFGSEKIKTPNIDRLAKEGRRMTSFYVASSVCTPSRAALLTGCYPKRVGLHRHVLFPQSTTGLNPEKTTTIADVLKTVGYKTACVGKWHLGHHAETLPTTQGFDSYYGIPYSNDMSHPDNKSKWRGSLDPIWKAQAESFSKWNAPLVEGTEIIEAPADQRTITRRYTDRAIEFISENKDQPFFLYLAHSMPHIPLFVPDDVADPDPQNAYTCVIEHIDDQVGRIADKLRELGLDKNTYLIYTSDNGPWLQFKHHGGSAGPLRAGKGTTYEGGQRVPCVVWAPGRVPAGTESDAFTSTMDILPTIADLAGAKLPEQRIDGHNIRGSLTGKADSPRKEMVFYTARGELEGIRSGNWKFLLKNSKKKATPELYDLSSDLAESANLAKSKPEVVESLTQRMRALDKEITEHAIPVWTKP